MQCFLGWCFIIYPLMAAQTPYQSGIIDWVLPADTNWDTTALINELSRNEWLAERIDLAIAAYPHLKEDWEELKAYESHPVEQAILNYQQSKSQGAGVVSVTDLEHYLRQQGEDEQLHLYLSLLKALIRRAQSDPVKIGPLGHFRGYFPTQKNRSKKISSSKSFSKYMRDDLLEFTKPNSFTLEQWTRFLENERIFW